MQPLDAFGCPLPPLPMAQVSEEETAASFVDSVRPGGFMYELLHAGQARSPMALDCFG